MKGNDIPIENLKGLKQIYIADYYYSYPFSMKLEDDFLHENCICVAVTRYKNPHTNYDLIGFNIEFKKIINRNTYKDKLDLRGFECFGLALIKTTEEESQNIINDLKSNSNFFVYKASDLY